MEASRKVLNTRTDPSGVVVVDFETTGAVRGYANEAWEIGLVVLRGGGVEKASAFSSLLRVGPRPFNPRAPGRHDSLRKELAAAPRFSDIWPALKPRLLGVPLAAHNVSTEKSVLRRLAPMHAFGPWIDTLKLMRMAYPDMKSHALEDCLRSLDLMKAVRAMCPDGEPHMALFDAVGSAVLLAFLLEQPNWQGLSIEALAHARPLRYYRRKPISNGRPMDS